MKIAVEERIEERKRSAGAVDRLVKNNGQNGLYKVSTSAKRDDRLKKMRKERVCEGRRGVMSR